MYNHGFHIILSYINYFNNYKEEIQVLSEYFAICFNSLSKVIISRFVLKIDGETRTAPLGSVPNVRCAAGEQCKPPLTQIPLALNAATTSEDGILPTLNSAIGANFPFS